jgi:tRNA A-37 threonylcarbamoyl transferase component Bud32
MEADASLGGAVLLGGRYALGGLVGRGGMAQVYRAQDRVLGRTVAVKMLRAIAAHDDERARFSDEARMLAGLSHPGLVTVLDAATSDDEPYLVMEFVDGPSLADCCRDGALEPERVATIGAELADALGHVHAAGIVHRDLKPANVLLGGDGRARLTDFGLARIMSAALRHTTTGATVGTPAYLAPEQVRGDEITPAVDMYSLGLVLIEALTGECPYRGLPVEAALARLTVPPAIPDTLPRSWHVLLRAMTALDPADRPSTAQAAAALRTLASGATSPAASLRRFAAERWHVAAGVTAGMLLVVLTSAWFGGMSPEDRPRGSVSERQGSGRVADELRAPNLAHSVRSLLGREGVVPVASRRGRRVDVRQRSATMDAETGDLAVPADPVAADARTPATGGDGVAMDDAAPAEPANPATVPLEAPADDDMTDGSGDTDGENDGESTGNGNAGGNANGKGNAKGNSNGKGNSASAASGSSGNGAATTMAANNGNADGVGISAGNAAGGAD